MQRVTAAIAVAVLGVPALACSDSSPAGGGPDGSGVPSGLSVPASTETAPDDARLERDCVAEGGRVSVVSADGTRLHVDELARRFEDRTGIEVDFRRVDSELAADEAAVIAGGSDGSDVVELGLRGLETWRRDGLLAATPALVGRYASAIPAGLLDAGEGWASPWVSAVAFLVDPSVEEVPRTFEALADDRSLTVGLVGDPVVSESALAAVVAASVAAGGSADDVVPGIDWFAALAARGRLVASDPDVLIGLGDDLVARRRSPAVDDAAELVFPGDALVALPSPSAVLGGSDRPSCAVRWLRWLLSEDGAYVVGEGGGLPARWATRDALTGAPARIRLLQPPPPRLDRLRVLTADMVAMAGEAVRETWRSRIGRLR